MLRPRLVVVENEKQVKYGDIRMNTQKTILASVFTMMFSSAHGAQEAVKNDEANQALDKVEVIQVYGAIRRSFEGAIGLKRTADTVIDAITAEDIGQFSDDSIAGAIQRIPGVQIETDDSGTQGDRVSIRGLGPEFVNSTINGRRLLSSGTEARSLRQMNFNVFPANVLGGVQVAKGQTASRPESGLAGQVDLQTLKPLEINKLNDKTQFATVSVEGRHQDVTDETGFRVNAIIGARNEEETLGGYVAFVYADEKNARDQHRVNSGIRNVRLDTDGDGDEDDIVSGVQVPLTSSLNPIRETPTRHSIASGIQYKPTEDININWDLMYSNYDNGSRRQALQIQPAPSWGGTVFDVSDTANPSVIIDENNVLQYADYGQSTGGGVIRSNIRGMVFDNSNENLITGLNIDYYISDNLSSNFDVYVSTVDYKQDLRFTHFRKNLDKSDFSYDSRVTVPKFNASDINEVAGYSYFRSIVRQIEMDGENYGATSAFKYSFDDGIITSVDFGAHYDETTIDVKTGNIEPLTNADLASDILTAGISGDLIDQDFIAGENFAPARWLYTDYDAVAALDPRLNSTTLEDTGINATASYEMTESILAFYAQANLETEAFDLPLKGNAGLRAVYTDQEATAAEFVDDVESPVTTTSDYWEYLPSLNLSLELQDDLILRFGLSKTLTRPDYEIMAPINNVRTPEQEEGEAEAIGTARVGNPNLNPMTSINTDLTLEWYTEDDGAFIFSAFHKDVNDFILINTQEEVPHAGYDGLYNVTTYVNYSDGTAQGLELGIFQPMDKIIPELAGFGFSANYTYVDSEFDKDTGDAGFGFPGSSKDNFNFIAFYDQDAYSVRLAYVYRSSFFRQLAGTGAQTDSAIFTEAQGKVDLSAVVRPAKNLSLRFNASNLTGENRRDFVGVETTFLDYYDRGRTYSVTATYNF